MKKDKNIKRIIPLLAIALIVSAFPVKLFADSTIPQLVQNTDDIMVLADYGNVVVQRINPIIYGVSAHAGPGGFVNNTTYRDLVDELGGVTLHLPSSAYKSKWNMLTGETSNPAKPSMTLAELKQFSDDCGGKVKIYPIINWKLYASQQYGGEGKDIKAVIRWLKDSGWPLEYWQYWRIGSELYGDWDAEYVESGKTYGLICKEIYAKMKEVEPNLKCGLTSDVIWKPGWLGNALDECKDVVDFLDFHQYPHDGFGGVGDYTAPLGVMGQEPFVRKVLLPKFKTLIREHGGGKDFEILFSEYDFWGMDNVNGSSSSVYGKNTTLADALAWGDQIGYCLNLGINLGGGYYFAGGGSYGMLLGWENGEQIGRSIIYSPKVWAIALWQKYFGTTMVNCSVNGSPEYIPTTGRSGFANLSSPVPYVTAYAGLDNAHQRATLVIINKNNDKSYNLNISLSDIGIDPSEETDVYTLTTDDSKGLLAWQDRYGVSGASSQQIFPPEHSTINVGGSSFTYTVGPHSMCVLSMPYTVTKIKDVNQDKTFSLSQNYPNPFNSSTTIQYTVPSSEHLVLKIFDLLKREVTTLVNGQKLAGTYSVQWNGTNNNGQQAGDGVYFYQLKTNNGITETKKMLFLK